MDDQQNRRAESGLHAGSEAIGNSEGGDAGGVSGRGEGNIYLPDDRVTGCLFVTALFLVCVATVGVLALYEMARAWWVG